MSTNRVFRKITAKTYKNTIRYETMLVRKQNKLKHRHPSLFCFQPAEPNLDTAKDNEPIIQNDNFFKKFFSRNKKKPARNLTNLLALSQFQIDDHVNIDFDFDSVLKLQVDHGGWCEAMFEVRCILFIYLFTFYSYLRLFFCDIFKKKFFF